MPVSATAFLAWLNTDVRRVLLAEVGYVFESDTSPQEPVEARRYFSRGGYATTDSELPASTPYDDRILAVSFSRSIDPDGVRDEMNDPELVLDNHDGELDYLLDQIIDGYQVEFYIGAPTWQRSDFRLIAVALAERATADLTTLRLKLRDKRLLLDAEIKGDPIGGSGPNATKYLPLLYGSNENVDLSGQLYDEATLTYSVLSNYGDTQVVALRDDGIPLQDDGVEWTSANTTADAGTNVVTHVNHGLRVDDVVGWRTAVGGAGEQYAYEYERPFAGFPLDVSRVTSPWVWVKTVPSPDTVTFSTTKGGSTLDITGTTWNPDNASAALQMVRRQYADTSDINGRIQLNSEPQGKLTADVFNLGIGAESSPFLQAFGLIQDFGNIVSDIDDISIADAEDADTALDAKVSVGYTNLAIFDRKNLLPVLDELIGSVFGWYGQNYRGVITFGLLDVSGISAATPDHTLPEKEIDEISVENLPVTFGRITVNYEPNHTPQGELSRLIAEPERTRYSAPWGAAQRSTAPSGTGYPTNRPLYHRSMTEGAPRFANMTSRSFGSTTVISLANYANELVADQVPHRQLIRVKTQIDKYDWDLGEVVEITYPRFGLSGGENARIVGHALDPVTGTVELLMLRHNSPPSTVFVDEGDEDFTVEDILLLVHADTNPPVDASNYGHALTFYDGMAYINSGAKFGAGSLDTDPDVGGNNDRMEVAHATAFVFTGDFTVECWVNTNTNAFGLFGSVATAGQGHWQVRVTGTSGDETVSFRHDIGAGAVALFSSAAGDHIGDGSYHHVALVRSGSTMSIYVDGVRIATGSSSEIYGTAAGIVIGAAPGTLALDGRIDEVRVSSVAQYSGASFTPPTAAFSDP